MGIPRMLWMLIVLFYVMYLMFFFFDIKAARVKHFPKWVWFIICVISVPLGGIIYFIFGKDGKYYDE